MTKQLRSYQSECHEAVIKDYHNGITKSLICLFTGAGKTFLLIKLLERMGFKRVLWLSFQQELISQSGMAFIRDKWPEIYDKVDEMGFIEYCRRPDAKIGCIKEDIFNIDRQVTMGSVMTIHRRLDRISQTHFDCIVCDESHLFMSNTAMSVIRHLKPELLIGCTATPHRSDGLPLSDIFQKISFDYGLDKGIRDGWACEMDAVRVKTTTNLDAVKTTAGEFNLKDLTNEINTLSRNQQIVDSYKKYAEGRQCIAFCCDIKHAMDLAEQFRMNGYDCQAVSSNEELTPDRSENIKRYKNGELQIITNCNILTAGFDVPDTGAIIMASPTKSLTKYLQGAGRGARLKSDEYVKKYKQNCILIDIVDVTKRHNLVNAWELDKEKDPQDRTFITQEKREKLLAERARKALLEHERAEDERVKLLSLPKVKISNSYRMSEEVEAAQLNILGKLGYNVIDEHYTKAMFSEILGKQDAPLQSLKDLEKWGYRVDGPVSIAQHQLAKKEYESRATSKKK